MSILLRKLHQCLLIPLILMIEDIIAIATVMLDMDAQQLLTDAKKRHALHVEGDTTVQKLAQHILTIVVSRSMNVFQKAV